MISFTKRIAVAVLCLCLLPLPAIQARELVPVGTVVGLELQSGTVTVEGFDTVMGAEAKNAGIQAGDVLEKINGKTIHCSDDVRQALRQSTGTVTVVVRRGEKSHTCKVMPQITADGPKLGMYLRQGVTGIGTVTWYDPETGVFATLGHGVNGNAGLLPLTEGSAYSARVVAVNKGRSGKPGQLIGAVENKEPVGILTRNTAQGVFGKGENPWQGKAMEVADPGEVKTGSAVILSTVSGEGVQEYSVDILKIYPRAKHSGRNLLIRVTDARLLEITGGIVQGMSGSPIIQDGKLIGAVTHVLVNDPTTGYGIFIENMLDAAA
ncbi:MAG: SpoIVB peptidase [Ruminococcaceae bacterium]|nr:SpoIVB peptidase [Oscillospiraceae bacterium]